MAESPSLDKEDDYMGDLSKFLPPEPSHPSKPKKLPSTAKPADSQPSWKNPKTQIHNPQENRKSEKERKQLEEDEQTLANMQSAIPQSNIGFKLLKQMGYTPGSALGKEGKGRAEPVGLEIRRSRAGIGSVDPVKEKVRREKDKAERKRMNEDELMQEFGWRQKLRWRGRRVVVNYGKAKAALDQLENKDVVVVAGEEKNEDEEGDSDDDDDEEEEITEEDLQEILLKLRDEHRYCLFCGCQYDSADALLSDCPGINEDDH
ncbi:hypothetical protein Dimus_001915 [Dionaea muscipula]